MGEAERGDAAPRQTVTYFCSHDHRSVVTFAIEANVPESWDCPKCGLPASLDSENPPPAPKIEPYKTHLAYVKERRWRPRPPTSSTRPSPSSAPAARPARSSSDRVGASVRRCSAESAHLFAQSLPTSARLYVRELPSRRICSR